jgi:uncharacterized C2H2 Zn-finger protein
MNDVNFKPEEKLAEQPQQNRCERCGAVFRSPEELARHRSGCRDEKFS